MRRHELIYALNAGGVDKEAVARVDLEKMRLAGEHPVDNFLPRVLGPMTLRPGTESLQRIPSDADAHFLKFVRSVGTSYLLVFTDQAMRIMSDGAFVQVPLVSTSIATGSWTDESTSPATASGGATLSLTAGQQSSAILRQSVSVLLADRSKVNVLRINVGRGPVILRVGTTAGGEELIEDAELDTGVHKIGFTPGAATIYIEVRSDAPSILKTVAQIDFESVYLGVESDLVVPTPWTLSDLENLRTFQSIDVVFAGDGRNQQRRIEHRGTQSWGVCLYRSNDGPFAFGQDRMTMTPSGGSGNVTVTASENYFRSTHVGALLEITHRGKTVTSTFNDVEQTSDYITVIGVTGTRNFIRAGTSSSFVGTIVLERSFEVDEPTAWSTYASYVDGAVAFANTVVNDSQDNVTIHYRWRVSAYTSGSATMTLVYNSDVQTGICRITAYTNKTTVSAEVLVSFGRATASRNWRIGDWSDNRGWPRTPVIHDGRLMWFRDDTHYASVSDDYTNFDDAEEGDSAPFVRSVGSGGEEGVLWALSLDRLLTGTAGFEAIITASELDESLTPTSYTVRKPSRRGCANVQAVEYDDGAFFVQRSGRKLYEISTQQGTSKIKSKDVSRLNPESYRSGIVRLAVQQQPDTRIYALLEDGTLAVLTYERDDEVIAITRFTFPDGIVEDIDVIPETDQDDVYLLMLRGTERYIERLGKEYEQTAIGACTLLDAHKVLTTVSSITGATHLAGETVQVWADGARREDVTLDGSGVAALGATYSRVVYGKSYTGSFKSVKLAHAAQLGTAVGQTKQVKGAGVVLYNTCLDGVRVGPDEDHLDPMPDIVNGAARTPSQFFEHYDADIFPINSEWTPDARFYLEADSAEGPCTIQAIVLDIETRDGAAAGG